MLAFPSPARAAHPHIGVDCNHAVSAQQGLAYAVAVWPPQRWHRKWPKHSAIAAHRHQVRCAAGPGHRVAIQRQWRRLRAAFYRHRHRKLAQLERLRYLPYACGGGTRSAIPCYIMWCESGGSYTARNPSSTAGGRYQILDSTWYAYGGHPNGDSSPAAAAPPVEQDRIAAAIFADVGSGAWECS